MKETLKDMDRGQIVDSFNQVCDANEDIIADLGKWKRRAVLNKAKFRVQKSKVRGLKRKLAMLKNGLSEEKE